MHYTQPTQHPITPPSLSATQYGRDSLSRGSTEDDKVDTIADSLERMSAFRSKYVKRIRLVVDDPVPLQILTNNYDGTLEYIQMECQMLGANNELHDAVFGTLTYRKFLVFVVGNTRVRKELIRRYKEASRLIKARDGGGGGFPIVCIAFNEGRGWWPVLRFGRFCFCYGGRVWQGSRLTWHYVQPRRIESGMPVYALTHLLYVRRGPPLRQRRGADLGH